MAKKESKEGLKERGRIEASNRILEAINRVFRERIMCDTEEQLGKVCLAVAEELTRSKFGYIGEINPAGRFDTTAMSDPGWDSCTYPESEIPILINNMEIRGIWGRVIKDGESLIVNDPMAHPDSVGLPKEHPPLTSFLGVPLKQGTRTFGMISLGNKEGGYEESDREAIEALAVAIWEAMRSKRTAEP
mgnify:CR=1 FL=1